MVFDWYKLDGVLLKMMFFWYCLDGVLLYMVFDII